MDKEKQIEEIAKDIADFELVDLEGMPHTLSEAFFPYDIRSIAEQFYKASYRKASEVVEEVTDEIFKILDAEYRQYDTATLNDTLNKMYMSSRNTIVKITAELVELKKKYTEKENNNEKL